MNQNELSFFSNEIRNLFPPLFAGIWWFLKYPRSQRKERKKEKGEGRKYNIQHIHFLIQNTTKNWTTNKTPYDICLLAENAYRNLAIRLARCTVVAVQTPVGRERPRGQLSSVSNVPWGGKRSAVRAGGSWGLKSSWGWAVWVERMGGWVYGVMAEDRRGQHCVQWLDMITES